MGEMRRPTRVIDLYSFVVGKVYIDCIPKIAVSSCYTSKNLETAFLHLLSSPCSAPPPLLQRTFQFNPLPGNGWSTQYTFILSNVSGEKI